ncbi:hypothetical protein B0H63DRAFT_486509 [Podospora didyma]|uniref:Secreted protein n=1 Tax=Podospora didyma TaxID=330526 RepID=A0AAE0N496_9PEZI|nr:hypothetical protein B0H63DRAFT_486509 [Podospora didyma]
MRWHSFFTRMLCVPLFPLGSGTGSVLLFVSPMTHFPGCMKIRLHTSRYLARAVECKFPAVPTSQAHPPPRRRSSPCQMIHGYQSGTKVSIRQTKARRPLGLKNKRIRWKWEKRWTTPSSDECIRNYLAHYYPSYVVIFGHKPPETRHAPDSNGNKCCAR